MPTKMELTLEETQQGVSYEVSRRSVKVKELQERCNIKAFQDKNANPFVPALPNELHVRITQELNELRAILAMIDSHLRIISSFDGEDLAFLCLIGFRKFIAYFNPFLPMNIITHKAYNTIMVEGLESMRKNLVAIVRDVYVFVRSFTYVMDYVVLEDIGEFIMIDTADVVMGRPFRAVTQLE
ncbi:hypothetical protein Tco_0542271 [Tanacetum coccineum]